MAGRRLQVVIVGAGGYTGGELTRLLITHPAVDIAGFVSSSSVGVDVATRIPHWRGQKPMVFETIAAAEKGDVVFFATPQGVAMHDAPALLQAGKVIIDLGPDFRLHDPTDFKRWYGEHSTAELLKQAVYGLSEAAQEQLTHANLIACPGCYATAINLALIPFASAGVINGAIIADAKSGVSGAGRRADRPDLLMAEMADNMKAYAVNGHRHQAEILQTLQTFTPPPPLTFIPHLLPTARGIYASIYLPITTPENARQILANHWRNAPFIEVLADGKIAEMAQTLYSNRVILSATPLPAAGMVLVCSTLDNLVKGAAGQAVQNMNIRFGLGETTGLAGARAHG